MSEDDDVQSGIDINPRLKLGLRGAPIAMTDETRAKLLTAIREGVPVDVAGAFAGVSGRTLRRWCEKGQDAESRMIEREAAIEAAREQDRPEPAPLVFTERERLYYDLWKEVEKARASSVTKQMVTLQKAAAGGSVVKETTRTYRDHQGHIVEEHEVTKTAPDWRAAAYVLEKVHRTHFGKDATVIELTGGENIGAGAGTVDAADLASRVLANMVAAGQAAVAEQEAHLAIEGGTLDVHDAEIVEEGP